MSGKDGVAELQKELVQLRGEVAQLIEEKEDLVRMNRTLRALYDCATGAVEELPSDVRAFVSGMPENAGLPEGIRPWQILGAVCA